MRNLIKAYWPILLIMAAAFIMRFIGIGHHSFWFDEGLEIKRTFTPWPDILFLAEGPDPPGYRLLLSLFSHIAVNETLLRLPSAIFGAFSVVLMFLWLRLLQQPKLGLLAAGLLAFSPIAIYYSQETSQYSLVIFLTLLLIIAFERAAQTGSKWDWLLLGAAGLASFFTYYGLIFLFPILDIRLILSLWKTRTKEKTVGFITVHLAWLLGLAFLYVYFIQTQYAYMDGGSQRAFLSTMSWQSIPLDFFNKMLHLVIQFQVTIFSDTVPIILPYLLALAVVIGMVLVWKLMAEGRHLIWSALGLVALLYVAAGFGFYLFGYRYTLLLLPYLIVFLAATIWGIYHYSHVGGYVCACIIFGIFLWFSPNIRLLPNPWLALPREELRPMLDYLHENKQADDFVYVYYGAKPAFQVYERDADYDYAFGSWFEEWATEEKTADIFKAVQNHDQFWLVMSHITPQEDEELRNAITASPYGYQLTDDYKGDNARIMAFRKSP